MGKQLAAVLSDILKSEFPIKHHHPLIQYILKSKVRTKPFLMITSEYLLLTFYLTGKRKDNFS